MFHTLSHHDISSMKRIPIIHIHNCAFNCKVQTVVNEHRGM